VAAFAIALSAVPARAILTGLPSGFVDELVVGGLPFPTAVSFLPDGRMLVALKRGEVRMYDGTTPLGTFIDLSAIVHDSHDRGLLGLTAHPSFPTVPYVYLLFTHDPPGVYPDAIDPSQPGTVPSRVAQLLRVEADPATNYTTAKPGTQVVLLGTNSIRANIGNENDGRDIDFVTCNSPATPAGTPIQDCIPSDSNTHTIGTVVFAPDGSLFVSSGDASGASVVDPRALRSQDLNSLAGKILRIDPITGAGLPDNPFYDADAPHSNMSKVWSYGVRNPFRIALHPATGEPFIGDVGWNTWEEIDTGKGVNFGWPCYEGGAVTPPEGGITTSRVQTAYRSNTITRPSCLALYDQGLGAVKAPTFSYDHSGGESSSANGGAFYTGGPYPPEYDGALFITDYNRRWIRYLTFDAQGVATAHDFGVADSGPVQLVIGPDSNLYWMKHQSTGGELRRVRYTGAGNTPPVVIVAATPTIGFAPLGVAFDSTGSHDPDAQGFDYLWEFGDGATSTEPNPSHVYLDPGIYDAVLTLTEQTAPGASNSETLRITVGSNPPIATILDPSNGATYRVGDVIQFAGSATSGFDPVPADQLTWELRTVHNQHLHFDAQPAAPDPLDPFLSVGSFSVSDHGDEVRLQLCLTVTLAPEGVLDTQCVDLYPEKTEVTLQTVPAGLKVAYEDEGMELSTPALIHPVVNSLQTISVLQVQQHRSFVQWLDGELSRSRSFVTGTAPETFTALYENLAPTAVISPAGASGASPLTVAFQGGGSSDPEGDTLEYAWDAGAAGTSSEASPSFTFPAVGEYLVSLTVTDQLGAAHTSQVGVSVNDGAPVPLITSPGASASWRADGAVVYAGEAVDPNAGPLPPSQLSWEFYLLYCDAAGQSCQEQLVGSAEGVAGGSLFVPAVFAPGSLQPSYLELRLTARTLAAEGWFDTAWTRRRALTLDNTAQAETLVDFPVLVRLDPSRIQYGATLPGGHDLRFTDASGQLLSHEIELWNPSGESLVWVKVPTVPAGSGTEQIFMYYGNPAAPDGQDPPGVWTNGYAAVWHLSGDPNDSTAHANDGTDEGSTAGPGRLGGGRSLDGVDDSIRVPTSPSLEIAGPISLEAWVQVPFTNQPGVGRILNKKLEWLSTEGYDLGYEAALNRVSSVGRGSSYLRATGVDLDASWHYLASTMTGTTGSIYVDGVDRTTDNTVNAPHASSQPLRIGQLGGGGDAFLGGLDEVRISHVARSAAWFAAQHRSMTDAFLGFSPEQTPTVLASTTALRIAPATVALSFETDPPGLALSIGGQAVTAPAAVAAIVGATASVHAPSPQTLGGQLQVFSSWSDGGAQGHLVAAPETPASWTAHFVTIPACNDGLDNDGDGQTDYPADVGCRDAGWANEAPACDDGLDNDGDGKRDWDGAGAGAPDPQCTSPWKRMEDGGGRACGLGFELVFLAPLALRLRRLKRLRA
jgi:glucose/arabinose dehydrogenase